MVKSDSYWPLRRKVRGQSLPYVYRRAPQKILSYNSEDYTFSDFFFFSPIGLAKSFLKFSCNIVLKNLNELLGQPNIFMVIKGATSASPAYLIVPWAGGSPERGWAHRFPKPAVQRIHHSHRPAAFCPHCSSVTGGHSSSPEEPCSGCPQNGHGLFFKAEIPRKEYNILLKSAISLSHHYLQPGKAWCLRTVESPALFVSVTISPLPFLLNTVSASHETI